MNAIIKNPRSQQCHNLLEDENYGLGRASIFIDKKELEHVLYTRKNEKVSKWLSEQRIESPSISTTLGGYLSSLAEEMKCLELRSQINHLAAIEAKLMGLPLLEETKEWEELNETLGSILRVTAPHELLFSEHPWFRDLIEGANAALPPPIPGKTIQLQHRRYKKGDSPYTINPGRIGPNYIHTWALDLVNVKAFRFSMKGWGPIMLYSSPNFGKDKLTVIDSCNRVLQIFSTLSDFHNKIVDLQKYPPCPYDAQRPPYKRIYLVLETTNDPMPGSNRKFVVEALEHTTNLTGNEKAYIVADEINYDYFDSSVQPPNNNDFVEAYDRLGNSIQIYPPWGGGPQGANNNLRPSFKTRPSKEKGWYLLGMNTTYADQDFFSVVYYNEQKAKLRIYLYNLSHAGEHTANVVKVYLEGVHQVEEEPNEDPDLPPRRIGSFRPLQGAFFPVDANPKLWSSAEIVISGWKPKTWTAVDVPVLYPMGSNFQAVGHHKLGSSIYGQNQPTSGVGAKDLNCQQPQRSIQRYRSLYEDQFAEYHRNVRLVIAVRSFDRGYADFDLIAQATGQVVQQSSPQWARLRALGNTIKAGMEWYGYAKGFGDLVIDQLKKGLKDAKGSQKKAAEDLIGKFTLGFNILSGIVGTVGAALELFGGYLSDEDMTLSILLGIEGKISGTMDIHHIERENRFYLPGRFSMIDAINVDGIITDDIRKSIDSVIPRYDRPLGIFGFAYSPWEVEVNLSTWLRLGQPIRHGIPLDVSEDCFHFPAREEIFVTHGNSATVPYYEYNSRLLPDLLPVILNPYAEIDVIPALPAKTYEYVVSSYRYFDGCEHEHRFQTRPSEIFLVANDRAEERIFHSQLFWSYYTGYPKTTKQKIDPNNPSLPPLRIDLTKLHLPKQEVEISPLNPAYFEDRRGIDVNIHYAINYTKDGAEILDWTTLAPMLLTDVIYYWKLQYIYWGDTHNGSCNAQPKAEEVMLYSPISLRLLINGKNANSLLVESSFLK